MNRPMFSSPLDAEVAAIVDTGLTKTREPIAGGLSDEMHPVSNGGRIEGEHVKKMVRARGR